MLVKLRISWGGGQFRTKIRNFSQISFSWHSQTLLCLCSLATSQPVDYIHQSPSKQELESPPAWTQEAYRPPCSEYSFCCPILADLPPLGWTDPPPGWVSWLTPPPAPPVDRQNHGWMDRHVSKNYLPVVLRTRAVTSCVYLHYWSVERRWPHPPFWQQQHCKFGYRQEFCSILPALQQPNYDFLRHPNCTSQP